MFGFGFPSSSSVYCHLTGQNVVGTHAYTNNIRWRRERWLRDLCNLIHANLQPRAPSAGDTGKVGTPGLDDRGDKSRRISARRMSLAGANLLCPSSKNPLSYGMVDKQPRSDSEATRDESSVPSLKERFERFMSFGDFAESIDALMMTDNVPGRRKADYLACGRSVIIEQKSIDHDVDSQIRAVLDDLVRQHGPLDCEHVTLAGIIDLVAKLPPGDLFKRRLLTILTKRIDDYLAEADKQTRDTRLTFGIPDAVGVVVVLNEHAQLIEPDYFVFKAWTMLHKEAEPGRLRYPNNQVVFLISEAHRIPPADGSEKIPVETIFSEAAPANSPADLFAADLRRRWAEFNHAGTLDWSEPIREVTTRDPAMMFKTR